MISPKNIPIRLTMILASLCSTAQGGEGFYCNTRDGACVPKRLTYGYTPTTWRRWPNEGTPSVARPSAEQIPTPARQTPPGTGPGTTPATPDDAPSTPTPDESPLVPTDSVPGGSTPSAEPLLTPPFDDTPPAPPQGPESGSNPPAATTAPGEMTVPKSLAEPPSRIRSALPEADPPPAMPDDDPFKDDLPGPPNPLDEPTKKGARLTPSIDENIRTTATEWQSPAKTAEVFVEGPQLKPIPAADEPRRLRPVDENAAGTVALPPVNVPVKHNPLRAAAQERRSERVVPTANWTVEQRASTATAASRRNPLRSN